jgi:predicted nucleotidyltransferase component of viral defense system
MQDLIKQEQFEMEVLDRLNSGRFLKDLIFGGGTLLRLCYGLNRFSVDLDFWSMKELDAKPLLKDLKEYLSSFYAIRDAANKFHTLLFEIKSKDYPRSLKIEIRKQPKKIKTEQAIAYSAHAPTQVLLRAATLDEMMKAKLEALMARREIRDAFDLEFLVKKGVALPAPQDVLSKALGVIDSFDKKDYMVKLGSLLGPAERKYYAASGFKILKLAIQERLKA